MPDINEVSLLRWSKKQYEEQKRTNELLARLVELLEWQTQQQYQQQAQPPR